jgi:hypothetical protein
MTPIYLSADNPRWTPKSEVDIEAGITGGLLVESHYLDLKEVPATRGDNKEAARDLVSFAIDGGTLIYGIAEDKPNRTFTLAPQPLNGLAEKMEQIALSSLVDPVLSIVSDEIPSDADPTQGYLVVHIPASPLAPHMADGRYYGRNDKTKYVLSDPEILRLHQRRQAADRDALALLQAEIDSDPIPADQRQQAHLFLLAQPLAGRPDMLFDLASGPQWNQNLARFLQQAFTPELNALLNGAGFEPSLLYAGSGSRRSRGAARATPNLGNGRRFTPTQSASPEDAVELQVHEDGGLRVFMSRFSDRLPVSSIRPAPENVILDAAALDYTHRFLALVRAAADQAGYFGNWALAFGATGLQGLRAYGSNNIAFFSASAVYDVDTYTQTTSVSWAELINVPGTITRRLVGPLLRALAIEEQYSALLTDPAPPTS